MRSFAVLCSFLAIAAVGYAGQQLAALDGIWAGQTQGRNGEPQDVAFRFYVHGSELTGKMYGESESLPISEGKLEADRITFRVTTEMNGGLSYFQFTGRVMDGEIQLTRVRELPPDADEEQKKRNSPQTFKIKRLI